MNQEIKIPKYIYLYSTCQAINLITAIIAANISAIIGNIICENNIYSTIPYGMQFLFLLISTYPIALLMEKKN